MIREDLQEIKRDVKRIYAILHGNGRGGLVTRQALSEARLDQLENSKKSGTRRLWGIVMLLIAAGVGVIGALLVK